MGNTNNARVPSYKALSYLAPARVLQITLGWFDVEFRSRQCSKSWTRMERGTYRGTTTPFLSGV
eukprot:1380620-Amorphochlora_amoeboformis.AAC.1